MVAPAGPAEGPILDPPAGGAPPGRPTSTFARIGRARLRRAQRPGGPTVVALAAAVLTFIAVITALSELRFVELTTTTWDLGIYQQALWTSAHGKPFFEAADYETGGFGSFLQVHSAFILYALAPLYSTFPSPSTLFAVQAGVVGAAAVPLYALSRGLGASPRRALIVAVLYLTSAFTISAALYDFHIEAFLPIEVFTLVYFWNARNYAAGALTALLGFLTMEAFPALSFAVALFFLFGELWGPPSAGTDRSAQPRGALAWAWLRRPPAGAAIALALASVVAYYLLLAARTDYLSQFAGFPPFPSRPAGYLIGGSPAALGLSVDALSDGFFAKTTYWLAAFALVGFLPLRAPRSLVLSLPWMAFTFLSTDLNLVTMGFQYGFLVVAGIFPAVAYAVAPPSGQPRVSPWAEPRERPRRRGVASGGLVLLLVLSLVGTNIALSPLDPLAQGQGPGSAYHLSYRVPGGFSDAARVASMVPAGSPVLASDFLFPLVANDARAYSLFWQPNPYLVLPFNSSNPPEFVLLAESRLAAVPPWLETELGESQVYGLRAVAWSTPVGAAILFQQGYSGPALTIGATPATSWRVAPASAGYGGSSWLVSAPGTAYGTAVESIPYGSGQLWVISGIDLSPGEYRVTLWLKAWPTDSATPADANVTSLLIQGSAFAGRVWFQEALPFGALAGAGFEPLEVYFNTSTPAFDFAIRGYGTTSSVGIGLSALSVDAV